MNRSILHIDGDSFFVSCEQTRNRALKNKPVVTGGERGIVSALSREAKDLGIVRGMPIHSVKKLFPTVVVIPSDFHLYRLYAQRVYAIVKRFSDNVEPYSIDECFADISNSVERHGMTPESLGRLIKREMEIELGITFGVGLAANKTLAKIASRRAKPAGFYHLQDSHYDEVFKETSIASIWGIGKSASAYLREQGVHTVTQFLALPEQWVTSTLSKPFQHKRLELLGHYMNPVESSSGDIPKSISSTQTFPRSTSNPAFLQAELSRHVEDVCYRARMYGLVAARVSFFLKTHTFEYLRCEHIFDVATASPQEILDNVYAQFDSMYHPNALYRTAGCTLSGLKDARVTQGSLFGEKKREPVLMEVIDAINKKYKHKMLGLVSSLSGHHSYYTNDDVLKRLSIPFLGEVH